VRANRPSLTARWVAARRAQLARTRSSTPAGDVDGEHALYRDVSGAFVVSLARPAGIAHRTAFIDGEVAGAIGRGIGQIVILGAGYDGRALRFGGGPTRWFEVDFPSTQADKRRRLDALALAPAHVAYVPLDLMVDDLDAALATAGHDATAPSLFICEGLLPYLTLESSVALLRTLRDRAPVGSVLVATFLAAPEPRDLLLAWRRARDVLFRAIGEPRRNEFQPGDPEKLYVVTGWRVVRAKSGRASRIDRNAEMVILAAEPDAVR
jgi:methyltransferase (TIGR00027 family)